MCGLGTAKQVGVGAARCGALSGLDFCFFLSRKRKSHNRLANMALCTFFLIKNACPEFTSGYQKIKGKQMLYTVPPPHPHVFPFPAPPRRVPKGCSLKNNFYYQKLRNISYLYTAP